MCIHFMCAFQLIQSMFTFPVLITLRRINTVVNTNAIHGIQLHQLFPDVYYGLVFVLAATADVYVKSVAEIEALMGTAGMFNVFHSLRMFHVVLV